MLHDLLLYVPHFSTRRRLVQVDDKNSVLYTQYVANGRRDSAGQKVAEFNSGRASILKRSPSVRLGNAGAHACVRIKRNF